MTDVEERVTLTKLADIYAPLLTPHRREILQLYCEEDLSLGEIAEQLGITRQGVFDTLKKARRQIEGWESRLNLLAQSEERARLIEEAKALLEGIGAQSEKADALKDILSELSQGR